MSLTLWGRASSVNVQKVLWALAEFGLDHRHEVVGGRYGGLDDPVFAALVPVPRVPVLQDGDLVLWESNAVLRHLARRAPDHPLGQALANLSRAARIDPWMDFGATTVQPAFIGLFWQRVRTPPADRDARAEDKALAGLTEALGVIERAMGDGRTHLAGAEFSLADLAVGTMLHRTFDIAPDLASALPRVAAWRDRLAERPGYRAHVGVGYEELRAT